METSTIRHPGWATPEGTARYQERAENVGHTAPGHFRETFQGLRLSSLGMGSYLGEPDEGTTQEMIAAVRQSVESGAINLLDTAINYRFQMSERSFGAALGQMITEGKIQRDEVFVASKNGFLTPDAAVETPFQNYFAETYIKTGLVDPQDIVAGMHCMSPAYLADQLTRSLDNLGLETLDLMYLHNAVESQLPVVGREVFMQRLEAAFRFYETARQEGKIRYYGLATWDCFRIAPDQPNWINLEDVVEVAERVGGADHGFRFVQLPFNLAFPEALIRGTQSIAGETMGFLQAAHTLGIGVFTSVPLMQGNLLGEEGVPSFEGLSTPAQFCLQFVRSTPVILAPLVGHKKPAHVAENLAVAKVSPLEESAYMAKFLTPAS